MKEIMNKEPLLFLCHRIPFPPNKGDKIRSFNILKQLHEQFDVHLGCFIDDPYDMRYVSELEKYCKVLFYRQQNKTACKIKGLSAFLTGKPITLPYYFDGAMDAWCKASMQTHQFKHIFVYSSSMAQYCEGAAFENSQRIIDFVDVDSDKWRQYADKKTGIAKYVYSREHKTLATYEDKICQHFDYSLFVSPDEASLFSQRQPRIHQDKVRGILNGVDVQYFDPSARTAEEPLVPKAPFISFTGAMDYWANIDAVLWFVDNVWAALKARIPGVKFVVAGGNPAPEIRALSKDEDIIVTGRVNDMRPFIAEAACIVAPLQIARGIQNKVLEAMSLNKPVVCTTMAMEGINASQSEHVKICDEPDAFLQQCISVIEAQDTLCANRTWIQEHFTWGATLRPLTELFACSSTKREVNHANSQ
ncbi:TIGR03087 family PEP-CTERM/XrtA system glycosyltransferase [Thalassotalea euphylliae]|uniref:TIGR03087 family PEP-CTERM/XrtA system glycosyltransferase n=1 Tax=Thalassotalea euphylliae TaxID=1655234 RepID=UPI003624BA30